MKQSNFWPLVLAVMSSVLSACSSGIDDVTLTEDLNKPTAAQMTTDSYPGVAPQPAIAVTDTVPGVATITTTQQASLPLPEQPSNQQPITSQPIAASAAMPVFSRAPAEFQVTLISLEIRRSSDQTLIDTNIEPISSDVLFVE